MTRTRRVLYAVAVAIVLALPVVVRASAGGDGIMDAICAVYPKDSIEWILFGCFLR